MKKIIILSFVVVSSFTACESTEEESTTAVTAPSVAAPVISPVTSASDTSLIKPVNSNITQVPVQAPVTQASPPPINMASAPKLNPAHGQPGHRCDLSVGAPLPQGGAPTVAAAQAATAQQPVQMTVPTPPPPVMRAPTTGTGKMVNPAHGQPGHRCDIAVGAPLN